MSKARTRAASFAGTATDGYVLTSDAVGVGSWEINTSPPILTSLDYPSDDTALDVVGEFNDATCDYNNDPTIAHDTNTNMKAGMSVSGTGIPVGATIASVTSSTAFELSVSTTGSLLENQTLTFNTQTLVITGSNFSENVTVTSAGTTPSTVTRDSDTQITLTGFPAKAAGTYVGSGGLVVTNSTGLVANTNVDYSPLPGWTSPVSGNLLDAFNGAITTINLVGGSPATTSYAITTGTFPTGSGLDFSTITGDISGTMSGSATTYNFTVSAIDAQAQSSPRLFNIISKGDAPTGGVITTYTGFRVHTFYLAGNGATNTFTSGASGTVDILVVAGGGGGGSEPAPGYGSSGGGAGGLVWTASHSVTAATPYSIVIGDGGNYRHTLNLAGYAGDESTALGITADGGGGGGNYTTGTGGNGGSGGGSNSTTVSSASQGNAGGVGAGGAAGSSGGGGGAGAVGQSGTPCNGGDGSSTFVGNATDTAALLWAARAGTDSSNVAIPASGGSNPGTIYIAGGGGGAFSDLVVSAGGKGGGGSYPTANATSIAGFVNTGGGGGGTAWDNSSGSKGGSGIVIIRYAV